jgi:hypothetical protein
VLRFLFIATIGLFLIAFSSSPYFKHTVKKKINVVRLIICTCGWTLTGLGLEMVELFKDKMIENV